VETNIFTAIAREGGMLIQNVLVITDLLSHNFFSKEQQQNITV